MKNIIIWAVVVLAAGISGFLIGRGSVKIVEKIEYIKLPPIAGSIDSTQLIPIKEEKPINPILPMKVIDTVYMIAVVDTAAIIEDYMLKRSYDLIAFDKPTLSRKLCK